MDLVEVLWVASVLTVFAMAFIIERGRWVKLCFGILRSWIWTLTRTNKKAPHYCRHIKERMICTFCPEHTVESKSSMRVSYCRIASKLREEGVLK